MTVGMVELNFRLSNAHLVQNCSELLRIVQNCSELFRIVPPISDSKNVTGCTDLQWKTDRQSDRHTDRQTVRQTHRQTDSQTDTQTDRQTLTVGQNSAVN